jgi:hypothetical protein
MYSHNPPWKSETKAIVLNSPMEFYDFVPPTGPKGGRVVVDAFILCIQGTVTVATAAWDGRDVPRLANLIDVLQIDNRSRWQLSGLKSRLASIWLNGIEQHQEHGNVAIGAAQAIDLRLIIPMAKRYTRRPKDFSLPADVFRKFVVNWATLAAAQTGTTVLSAFAANAYILAEWHEEDSVEFKSEDTVKTTDFTTQTQAKLALMGPVLDLFACKEGTSAGGGEAMTAITDVRIDEIGMPPLTRGDLAHSYRTKRGTTASGPTTPATERFLEPVQQGTVVPIIVACPETSVWDGKMVSSMKIDVGVGVASSSLVTREILDKSQAVYNKVTAEFHVDPGSLQMKTDKKSRTGMKAGWTDAQRLRAPWKAALKRAA